MANLFDKLNVLMRARVRGALGGGPRERRPQRAGPDLDREVAALRQQIEHALDDEEAQQQAMAALQAQIEDGDRRADEAVRVGDEATARHLVRQLQLDHQRLAMMEADLAAHRREASELIRQVNALEATVAEVHRAQTPDEPAQAAAGDLAARVRSTRERATAILKREPPPEREVDERTVEDDLAARRARLSQ